jgi:hypothetical protein
VDGAWIPLLEYAVKKGVSISTLRRYIKTERIRFKLERGRYFIHDGDSPAEHIPTALSPVASSDGAPGDAAPGPSVAELEKMRNELKCAQKEIAELKMLVAFYEDKFSDGATN